MCGARTSTAASAARNASAAPSTIGLWNAVATSRRLASMPSAVKCAMASSTMAVAPDSTTCVGWLWLATVRSSPQRLTFSVMSSSVPRTAHMAPGTVAAAAMDAPRAADARRKPSTSSAPAACSAATSPKLWPAAQDAFTPACVSTASRAALAAPSAGCALSVRWRRRAFTSRDASSNTGRGNTTSASGASAPKPRLAARSHTAIAASKLRARSPPMPRYWLPWPGNKKPTSPASDAGEYDAPFGITNAASGALRTREAASRSAAARETSSAATTASRAEPWWAA